MYTTAQCFVCDSTPSLFRWFHPRLSASSWTTPARYKSDHPWNHRNTSSRVKYSFTAMLSLTSLLNSETLFSRASKRHQHIQHTEHLSKHHTISSQYNCQVIIREQCQPQQGKQKMAKNGLVYVQSNVKGQVNFYPFDAYDSASRQQVQRFGIKTSRDQIMRCPRHIPYNSEKKSFLEKTGRESFEGKCLHIHK